MKIKQYCWGPGSFRFILSTFVIIHHFTRLSLGGAAVYLFFALSGYWICKMWESKYSKVQSPIITFIISRVWRLGPVFLFCSMLAVFITVLLPLLVPPVTTPEPLSIRNYITSFVLLGYNTNPQGPLGPAWSLDIEMQFYLLAPMILMALNKKPLMVSVIIISIGCASSLLFEEKLITSFLPFFLIGILAAKFPNYIHGKKKLTLSSALVIIIIFSFILSPTLRPVLFGGAHPSNLFKYNELLNILIALLVLPFALSTVIVPSNKLDKLLSDMSYSLYLFHWIPIIIVSYYFPSLSKQPIGTRTEIMVVILIFIYMASLAITVFIDRPLMKKRSTYVIDYKRISS